MRLLRGLDPEKHPRRYQGSILCVVLMESSFGAAAGLVWLVDDPYSKALAAGMVMTTALQLTTVRSIHLPFGLSGIATIAVTSLVAIWVHWADTDNWIGFSVTAAAAVAGIGYALTAMLSNNELHRATAEGRALAWASDTAKSRFLAQMSHELRTPLNAIIGLGQIEAANVQNAASRDRLETLVASARGLAVVLDDVLDLSSITDGRMALRPRVVDIRAELAIIVATFSHQAKARWLSLTLNCAADLPPLATFDPQRMRQCVINLISNALKHVKTGGISLAVRSDGNRLIIDVIDTGPGVPPGLHEAVFEPFRKASPSSTGTGLGLAISRSLARQMGGDLRLLPTFSGAWFQLSVLAPAAAAEEVHPASGTPDLTGTTILVVDDIATNRLVASSVLQRAGARVIEASGGQEALTFVTREAVDLVLLDMNMPDMDGLSTFRAMRKMQGAVSRMPVIAMTADVLPAQQAAIEAAGLDGYLAKPLVPEDLYALLRRHLGV
ncbi:response regulator [Tabrizicola sp.]|uniref:response regulator n=1 Tax=Tabrizicola sp. TaxID=2005166 RepID=UPI00286AE8A7|nr:response regulator [Tabrizicola sp.]